MNITDDELVQELSNRFAQSRKAFSDLSVVNRKLVEMNRKLEQSESLKSNFLSNIRNEIINPLGAILGMADQLASLGKENEDISRLVSQIGAEANGLDFQLRNIFVAAELEAGEVTPNYTSLQLPALLKNVLEQFRHAAEKKQVLLEVHPPACEDSSPTVQDYDKLFTIVANLLANAIEFSPVGGVVEITYETAEDGSLRLTVRDFGPGIPAEDRQLIFDRFVQLETGSTRCHLGHGLGLSVSRALADLLQGCIALEVIPGPGACFSIALPPGPDVEEECSFYPGGNMFLFDTPSEK